MAQDSLVSIIVPVYNTIAYLDQCLDSLVGQSLAQIEVVCVDDGSTDGSSQRLDERAAQDPRIRVIHQQNAGVSAARNAGLDAAQGEYVLFVDSDDYIDRYACAKLVNVARRDSADIVIFGGSTFPSVTWIDESMTTIDATYHEGGLEALFLARGAYPLMCNKLYKRSLIEAQHLRFNTTLRLGEDHAFQFCIFPLAKTVSSVRDPIYHYRCGREGSALQTSDANLITRAGRHFDMVEYVLATWQERDLIKGKASDLAVWMTEFLLSSTRELPLAQRVALSERYQALVDASGLAEAIAATTAAASRDRCLRVTMADAPLVSALVVGADADEGVDPCTLSLLHQELPFVQVIRVQDEGALPVDDPRVSNAPSLAEALRRAEGAYLLVAQTRDTYEAYALRVMTDTAAQAGQVIDVTTIQDRAGSLRVADLARLLRALSNDGTLREPAALRTCLSRDELPDQPLALFSSDCANKLWRRAFVEGFIADDMHGAWAGKALSQAAWFCPISEPYFQKGVLHLDVPQARTRARADVEQLLAWATELGQGTAETSRLLRTVAANLCLGTAERIATSAASTAYLDEWLTRLLASDLLVEDDGWWPQDTEDDDAWQALLRDGVDVLTGEQGQQTFERTYEKLCELHTRRAEYRRNLTDEREWRTQLLESMSFRAGRALTSAPRILRDAVKGVLHRR